MCRPKVEDDGVGGKGYRRLKLVFQRLGEVLDGIRRSVVTSDITLGCARADVAQGGPDALVICTGFEGAQGEGAA